jgi:hypothetical protein
MTKNLENTLLKFYVIYVWLFLLNFVWNNNGHKFKWWIYKKFYAINLSVWVSSNRICMLKSKNKIKGYSKSSSYICFPVYKESKTPKINYS